MPDITHVENEGLKNVQHDTEIRSPKTESGTPEHSISKMMFRTRRTVQISIDTGQKHADGLKKQISIYLSCSQTAMDLRRMPWLVQL
jgi:hypothetical protein